MSHQSLDPSRRVIRLQWGILIVYLALGFASLWANRDMPIVRNAVLYARIAHAFLCNDATFLSESLGYNKALGFPILSLPFIAQWGANIGLKVSSFIWTSCWILSVFAFFRRFVKRGAWAGATNVGMLAALLIFLLNPLVYYQFISGYPDTLDALSFLWAIIFLDRHLSRDGKWYDGLLFSATTLMAIWVKQHGFVILAILPVFMIARRNVMKILWEEKPRQMIIGVLSLIIMFGVLSGAHLGKIPGFNLTVSTSEYVGGFDAPMRQVFLSFKMILGYLVLSLSVLTPLLLRWPRWNAHKEWYLTIIVFMATILPYYGSTYNPRYLLPVTPLLVWIVANNLVKLPRAAIQVLVVSFLLINGFTTAYYNSRSVFEWASPALQLPLSENLRLNNGQRRAARSLAVIREQSHLGLSTLYFIEHYYGDGMWYVWQDEGLIPASMDVVYLKSPDWEAMKAHSIQHSVRRALMYAPQDQFYQDDLPSDIYLTEKGDRLYTVDFLQGVD